MGRNRRTRIDSETELDLRSRFGETRRMSQSLHLVRRDPRCNMARFYRLELCQTLFGQPVLIRSWGRIGTEGRRKESLLADPLDGELLLTEWSQKKQRRGYRAV